MVVSHLPNPLIHLVNSPPFSGRILKNHEHVAESLTFYLAPLSVQISS